MKEGHNLGMNATKKINNKQEHAYESGEYENIEMYIERYKDLIKDMSQKDKVTVLDVGGGAGYFIKELAARLPADTDVNIYILDTNTYATWNNDNPKIHYIDGDALEIDKIFEKNMFDYVFCNMFFHHLLGKSFKMSKRMRESVLAQIYNVLKDDGHAGIIDNFNDGMFIDGISCRIIYLMTNTKNLFFVKLFNKFGSKSAGVGVCMMSRKMWHNLIDTCNFKIVREYTTNPSPLKWYYRLCLMNKRYCYYNMMELKKY
jgi:ubiquinone/menaquinone biosynthesis C-methylase UbiE